MIDSDRIVARQDKNQQQGQRQTRSRSGCHDAIPAYDAFASVRSRCRHHHKKKNLMNERISESLAPEFESEERSQSCGLAVLGNKILMSWWCQK
mmetsp:Transcript_16021/g.37124  ORF Transcript_16021/g.37124 Transcript_16021/m.37124 type:complete len:94 (+) Transcript_16021:1168-1449(+)